MLKSALVLLSIATTILAGRVDPALQSLSSANIVITFAGGNAAPLSSAENQVFASRGDKIAALRLRLIEHAANSQRSVLELLEKRGVDFESFWINNSIFVKNADADLIQELSHLRNVAEIMEEPEYHIYHPFDLKEDVAAPNNFEWGVNLIQAPEAWALDGGNDGTGVRIATIDTGVRFTHEALKSNYFGKNGWFDPYQKTPQPNDQNGHGTHVTGTICGQGGIGVAPGASWLACKGCATFSCSLNALVACGQWAFCPHDPQGNNPDCSQAPHLVSNSWGGGQGQSYFNEVIKAWRSAEIIPIFAQGNSGPSCRSANSPGDHPDVLGVGATTNTDTLASFSSVGPSVFSQIKPDVSAPGANVRSSYHTSDTAYSSLSGTSMACPHTAGVVALLKGRNLDLSFDKVKLHLTTGIDRSIVKTGRNCGGVSEDTWPNNAFGFGRINALKALVSLLQEEAK